MEPKLLLQQPFSISIQAVQIMFYRDMLPSSRFELVLGESDVTAAEQSLKSAEQLITMCKSLHSNDVLLVLISGMFTNCCQ